MPNIASAFRSETARLARKEAQTLVEPLRKANTQYRREIAQLKRDLQAIKKEVTYLSSQEQKRLRKPAPVSQAKGVRFSPEWLVAHRERLGLAAADYAGNDVGAAVVGRDVHAHGPRPDVESQKQPDHQ